MTAQPIPVLADAQFDTVRVLRPFSTFETVYQDQPSYRPIMFTELGKERDSLAEKGETGYDPQLVKGISVPMGARLVFWLPMMMWWHEGNRTYYPYRWFFLFRLRNLHDYRIARIPWNFPRASGGAVDNSVVPPAERVVIPVANQSLIYVQTEPTNQLALSHAWFEEYGPYPGVSDLLPFLADGSLGHFQQGVFDPNASGALGPLFAWCSTFCQIELQATGNEVLVGLHRDGDLVGLGNWDFGPSSLPPTSAPDYNLGLLLTNSEQTGVYIMCGTAP